MTLALQFPVCKDSPLGRMDPRWKLAAIFPAALLVVFMRTPAGAASALCGAVLLAAVAKLPRRWYLVRLGALALFLSFFLVWLIFVPGRDEETLNFFGLTLSPAGLTRAGVLLAKGLTILSLMLTLFATATLPDTLKAAHALFIPALFLHLMLLTYRYTFLLADEFSRLRTALRVRGYRNRVSLHSYRTIGQVAGTLLVRGHDRSERVAQAMRCRGFDGQFRSVSEVRTGIWDVVGFMLLVAPALGVLSLDLAMYFET